MVCVYISVRSSVHGDARLKSYFAIFFSFSGNFFKGIYCARPSPRWWKVTDKGAKHVSCRSLGSRPKKKKKNVQIIRFYSLRFSVPHLFPDITRSSGNNNNNDRNNNNNWRVGVANILLFITCVRPTVSVLSSPPLSHGFYFRFGLVASSAVVSYYNIRTHLLTIISCVVVSTLLFSEHREGLKKNTAPPGVKLFI